MKLFSIVTLLSISARAAYLATDAAASSMEMIDCVAEDSNTSGGIPKGKLLRRQAGGRNRGNRFNNRDGFGNRGNNGGRGNRGRAL
ncbi:hypothetical protein DSO57_1007236 [Entomophthora muscae]|uniref:Uncharacterized protein n=1 Tax=Entomophthora muscae TaxID=34485 RepID=A0ACC2TI91_9FUNG|nr:hypothetical protein DSO57_1007236 [Entomophthora muscae]